VCLQLVVSVTRLLVADSIQNITKSSHVTHVFQGIYQSVINDTFTVKESKQAQHTGEGIPILVSVRAGRDCVVAAGVCI
jgi:hypothetical protein